MADKGKSTREINNTNSFIRVIQQSKILIRNNELGGRFGEIDGWRVKNCLSFIKP
jgi:hypothetical protein